MTDCGIDATKQSLRYFEVSTDKAVEILLTVTLFISSSRGSSNKFHKNWLDWAVNLEADCDIGWIRFAEDI